MNSPGLLPAAERARKQPRHSSHVLPEWYWTSLAAGKEQAVARGDEESAKAAWALETIGRTQDAFVSAFTMLRREEFKEAWDSLDRAEVELSFVERHFTDEHDEFGLRHIGIYVPRFLSILPYKWGLSPAYVHKKVVCGVCGSRITLRSDCGHVVGEIYDGEMCTRQVGEAELLHIAFVESPAQRYSVIDLDTAHPGFEPARFLVTGLRSPWDRWFVEKEERRAYHPVFKNTGRNEPCPCASGKKYKRCCLLSETVFPHFEFRFEHDPPPELPRLVVRPPGPA